MLVCVSENFTCSFLKPSLASDILVGVLCLEMSQGDSTDVDSFLYNSDIFLFIVVAESFHY